MSLFGSAGASGGMFPRDRASEAALQTPPTTSARPAAYTPRDGATDQQQRVDAQVGPAEKALEFGFRAEGGQQPRDTQGPGASRSGAGVGR